MIRVGFEPTIAVCIRGVKTIRALGRVTSEQCIKVSLYLSAQTSSEEE